MLVLECSHLPGHAQSLPQALRGNRYLDTVSYDEVRLKIDQQSVGS